MLLANEEIKMFGLEQQPKEKFAFDLEIELAKSPAKAKEIINKIQHRTEELKKLLREGGSQDDFDQYGILLHGYASLMRVLKKVTKSKK